MAERYRASSRARYQFGLGRSSLYLESADRNKHKCVSLGRQTIRVLARTRALFVLRHNDTRQNDPADSCAV